MCICFQVISNYPVGGGGAAPTSPLVSSPGDSRAASPRSRRRVSRERSPPPDQPPLAHLASNFENLNMAEVSIQCRQIHRLDSLINV